MRIAHQWAVELIRAITGKDQRTDIEHTALLKTVADIRTEMRNEDISILEKHRRRFEERAQQFKDEGNRAQWTVFYHYEQATAELIKAMRGATME